MYTGIITGKYKVHDLVERKGLNTFIIKLDEPHVKGLKIGASVSVNGVCLTVSKIDGKKVSFDAMHETLSLTNLGTVKKGDLVNIERSAKQGDEVGGHSISGHVDGVMKITEIHRPENNCVFTFQIPEGFTRYVFNKGFVALNGCSLTVSNLDREKGTFEVWLIPETLRLTTFEESELGDEINFEIDRQTQIIVDTVMVAVKEALKETTIPITNQE